MKDIGFGILNPYTVVITFVVLVLAQTLFGYPIPFDLSNASQLFVGLVLFTGYLYTAQSLVRLPIATVAVRLWLRKSWKLAEEYKTDLRGWQRIKYKFRTSFKLLRQSPLFIGYWFLFVINFTEEFNKHSKEIGVLPSLLLAILDRLALVLIVFLAVLPQFKTYFQPFAITGLFLLIVTFIFKGNLIGLLNDEIKKEDEKDKEKESESQEIMTSPFSEKERQKLLQEQNNAIKNMLENARAATQPTTRDTISGEVDTYDGTFG